MRDGATLLLSLGLLAGLAAGSYWVAEQARLSDPVVRPKGHDVDYTASDITLTRMDETGRAQYVIDAKKLVHYADDDSGDLTQPRLVGAKIGRPELRVRADRGKTLSDGQQVELFGNVVLNRAKWGTASELIAKGPYMLALPEQEILKSDQPVDVVQGASRVTANGMQYDNAYRKLDLDGGKDGRIRVVIEPRSRGAPTAGAPAPSPR